MNLSAPDAPQPGAPSEGAAMRFLRWLIEPPVETQPRMLRFVRWLLRATVFCLYCFCAGEAGGLDHETGGGGGVGRKNKPGKPSA